MVSVLRHNTRSSDKYLEEAQASAILNMSNKKFRNIFCLSSDKYDLCDTTDVDLSNNSLQEVPHELGSWYCLETLTMARNSISFMPDFFVNLCLLHTLDMSNNHLVHVSPIVSALTSLKILRLQNNKILSLPPQIGKLTSCQELDVSGNRIHQVPEQISGMETLFYLDLSRNQIEVLPEVISKLPLIHFDASSNNITMVPLIYQTINSLKHFNVTENPLKMPSLHVLKYGRIHFFKALEADLLKLQKVEQQSVDAAPLHRRLSKEDSFDTVIERFSSMSSSHDETLKQQDLENVFTGDIQPLKTKTAPTGISDVSTTQKLPQSTPKKASVARKNSINSSESQKQTSTDASSCKITSKSSSKSLTLTRVKSKQTTSSVATDKPTSSPKRSNLAKQTNKIPTAPPPPQLRAPRAVSIRVKSGEKRGIPIKTERKKSISSPKRAVKESGHASSATVSSTVTSTTAILSTVVSSATTQSAVAKKSCPKIKAQTTASSTKLPSKIASPSHTSSYPGYAPPQSSTTASTGAKTSAEQARYLNVIKPRKAHSISRNRQTPGGEDGAGGFTMRRKAEKMYEELELIESIRGKIEGVLKIRLGNDLQSALSDGVVLCQLANFVKARSIPTIHVPSPAVPKLSLAKARRNVENFLEVCPRLGVKPKEMCTSNDIMHEKGLSRVADTVNSLLKNSSPAKAQASSLNAAPKVSSTLHASATVRK